MYFIIGYVFLIVSKIKIIIGGYKSPKPFDFEDINRCIDYDLSIVNHWMNHLNIYTKTSNIKNKVILELGPGSDLGIGIKLLSLGAQKYNACDVNNLARTGTSCTLKLSIINLDFVVPFFLKE